MSDFLKLRAENNIKALPENEERHVRWLFEQPLHELLHHISAMTPTTGGPPNPRQVKMLECCFDYERVNKDRNTVLLRIKNALGMHFAADRLKKMLERDKRKSAPARR